MNSRRNLVALLWFVAGGAVVFGYCSLEFSFLSIRVVAVNDVAAALLSPSSALLLLPLWSLSLCIRTQNPKGNPKPGETPSPLRLSLTTASRCCAVSPCLPKPRSLFPFVFSLSSVLFIFATVVVVSCCSMNSRRNLVALLWFVAGGAVVFGYCSLEFSFLSIRVVAVDDVVAALLSSSSALLLLPLWPPSLCIRFDIQSSKFEVKQDQGVVVA
ncbi:hypothetical protein BVRB_001460 [Beta vulgaris subsp. vulgaris]|uniref:Transmembrane protein n=1 Tax=Beta vulgaris subsp. vulgaris TaxID=3555 RepID=A0A0J8DZ67_BETVV|nr:hypothetical protein BVRB_001460 [Beta vulgaris subsp. vulgaris]